MIVFWNTWLEDTNFIIMTKIVRNKLNEWTTIGHFAYSHNDNEAERSEWLCNMLFHNKNALQIRDSKHHEQCVQFDTNCTQLYQQSHHIRSVLVQLFVSWLHFFFFF